MEKDSGDANEGSTRDLLIPALGSQAVAGPVRAGPHDGLKVLQVGPYFSLIKACSSKPKTEAVIAIDYNDDQMEYNSHSVSAHAKPFHELDSQEVEFSQDPTDKQYVCLRCHKRFPIRLMVKVHNCHRKHVSVNVQSGRSHNFGLSDPDESLEESPVLSPEPKEISQNEDEKSLRSSAPFYEFVEENSQNNDEPKLCVIENVMHCSEEYFYSNQDIRNGAVEMTGFNQNTGDEIKSSVHDYKPAETNIEVAFVEQSANPIGMDYSTYYSDNDNYSDNELFHCFLCNNAYPDEDLLWEHTNKEHPLSEVSDQSVTLNLAEKDTTSQTQVINQEPLTSSTKDTYYQSVTLSDDHELIQQSEQTDCSSYSEYYETWCCTVNENDPKLCNSNRLRKSWLRSKNFGRNPMLAKPLRPRYIKTNSKIVVNNHKIEICDKSIRCNTDTLFSNKINDEFTNDHLISSEPNLALSSDAPVFQINNSSQDCCNAEPQQQTDEDEIIHSRDKDMYKNLINALEETAVPIIDIGELTKVQSTSKKTHILETTIQNDFESEEIILPESNYVFKASCNMCNRTFRNSKVYKQHTQSCKDSSQLTTVIQTKQRRVTIYPDYILGQTNQSLKEAPKANSDLNKSSMGTGSKNVKPVKKHMKHPAKRNNSENMGNEADSKSSTNEINSIDKMNLSDVNQDYIFDVEETLKANYVFKTQNKSYSDTIKVLDSEIFSDAAHFSQKQCLSQNESTTAKEEDLANVKTQNNSISEQKCQNRINSESNNVLDIEVYIEHEPTPNEMDLDNFDFKTQEPLHSESSNDTQIYNDGDPYFTYCKLRTKRKEKKLWDMSYKDFHNFLLNGNSEQPPSDQPYPDECTKSARESDIYHFGPELYGKDYCLNPMTNNIMMQSTLCESADHGLESGSGSLRPVAIGPDARSKQCDLDIDHTDYHKVLESSEPDLFSKSQQKLNDDMNQGNSRNNPINIRDYYRVWDKAVYCDMVETRYHVKVDIDKPIANGVIYVQTHDSEPHEPSNANARATHEHESVYDRASPRAARTRSVTRVGEPRAPRRLHPHLANVTTGRRQSEPYGTAEFERDSEDLIESNYEVMVPSQKGFNKIPESKRQYFENIKPKHRSNSLLLTKYQPTPIPVARDEGGSEVYEFEVKWNHATTKQSDECEHDNTGRDVTSTSSGEAVPSLKHTHGQREATNKLSRRHSHVGSTNRSHGHSNNALQSDNGQECMDICYTDDVVSQCDIHTSQPDATHGQQSRDTERDTNAATTATPRDTNAATAATSSDTHAATTATSSDTHAATTATSSDTHAATTATSSDTHAATTATSSDTHAATTATSSDTHAATTATSSDTHAATTATSSDTHAATTATSSDTHAATTATSSDTHAATTATSSDTHAATAAAPHVGTAVFPQPIRVTRQSVAIKRERTDSQDDYSCTDSRAPLGDVGDVATEMWMDIKREPWSAPEPALLAPHMCMELDPAVRVKTPPPSPRPRRPVGRPPGSTNRPRRRRTVFGRRRPSVIPVRAVVPSAGGAVAPSAGGAVAPSAGAAVAPSAGGAVARPRRTRMTRLQVRQLRQLSQPALVPLLRCDSPSYTETARVVLAPTRGASARASGRASGARLARTIYKLFRGYVTRSRRPATDDNIATGAGEGQSARDEPMESVRDEPMESARDEPREWRCGVCAQTFTCRLQRDTHEHRHRHECLCRRTFRTKRELIQHSLQHRRHLLALLGIAETAGGVHDGALPPHVSVAFVWQPPDHVDQYLDDARSTAAAAGR